MRRARIPSPGYARDERDRPPRRLHLPLESRTEASFSGRSKYRRHRAEPDPIRSAGGDRRGAQRHVSHHIAADRHRGQQRGRHRGECLRRRRRTRPAPRLRRTATSCFEYADGQSGLHRRSASSPTPTRHGTSYSEASQDGTTWTDGLHAPGSVDYVDGIWTDEYTAKHARDGTRFPGGARPAGERLPFASFTSARRPNEITVLAAKIRAHYVAQPFKNQSGAPSTNYFLERLASPERRLRSSCGPTCGRPPARAVEASTPSWYWGYPEDPGALAWRPSRSRSVGIRRSSTAWQSRWQIEGGKRARHRRSSWINRPGARPRSRRMRRSLRKRQREPRSPTFRCRTTRHENVLHLPPDLRLLRGKQYVGKSKDPAARFRGHAARRRAMRPSRTPSGSMAERTWRTGDHRHALAMKPTSSPPSVP